MLPKGQSSPLIPCRYVLARLSLAGALRALDRGDLHLRALGGHAEPGGDDEARMVLRGGGRPERTSGVRTERVKRTCGGWLESRLAGWLEVGGKKLEEFAVWSLFAGWWA